MNRIVRLVVALNVVAGLSASLSAQEQFGPKVSVVLNNSNQFLANLEFVVKLTNQTEQKQWPVLAENMDIFLIGVDRTKPIRMDVVFGEKGRRYITSIPVTNIKKFREDNLDLMGIASKKRNQKKDLYRLGGEVFTGFMRYLHGYAIIAEKEDEVPATLPDPREGIQPLLARNFDVVLGGHNQPEGQDERRQWFNNNRSELLALLKKQTNESQEDFDLRKLMFEHQLDEGERIYVEAKDLLLGGVTDVAGKSARFDLELTPLPGTSLDETVKLLGQAPSHFAKIGRSEKSIFSVRINAPLGESRRQNFAELFDALRARSKRQADASADLNEAQKTANKEIADIFFDLLSETANAGFADGFLEGHANSSGKNTLIGGFRAADTGRIIEALEKIPKASEHTTVALETDQAGDVKIHKVTISPDRHPNFLDFFGEKELYVGTEEKVVWFALGEKSLDELKDAIGKAGTADAAEPALRFADVFIKLGPWVELSHKIDPKKGDVELRNLAREAFKLGDDTVSLVLDRADERILGKAIGNVGILRFAGKVIAEFSKKNLDEQ